MTTKLISLAGLLLMLSSPAFADQTQEQALQVQNAAAQAQPAPAAQPNQQIAWQRVGSPLSLET